MSKPAFVVSVADLERGPKTVTWAISAAWLRETLEGTTAEPGETEGTLEAELTKNGSEIMVRGEARVQVVMPCVVTLDPLPFDLRAEVFLMLKPAPISASNPRRTKTRGRAAAAATAGESPGPAKVKNKGRPPESWDDAVELSAQEAAQDTFDGDKVVLDPFVRDFILLELPLYPRRSDLPSGQSVAIAPPAPPAADTVDRVDPRLAPLAAIASRLREQKKE